jgi:hypothetical protein
MKTVVLNENLKNLLVQTMFYWSWVRGPVLIVETVTEEVDYCSYLVYNFIYKCIYLVTDLLHNVRSSCVLLIDFC